MADLNSSVGDKTREDPMVEIRVAVPFDGACNEVRLRSEWESRAVVQVIDTVELDA